MEELPTACMLQYTLTAAIYAQAFNGLTVPEGSLVHFHYAEHCFFAGKKGREGGRKPKEM